jgi:hypothetical protein
MIRSRLNFVNDVVRLSAVLKVKTTPAVRHAGAIWREFGGKIAAKNPATAEG